MGELVGMVLCAGLGTRLRPLTLAAAKPAVPVCGVPLVRWALALLAGAGARRAVVNVHHLPDGMARAAEEAGRAVGLPVAVSREPVIAGTGGALREARPLLAGASELALVNGDVLFDLDLPAALAAHRAAGPRALATMVLAPMPAGASYAAVEADADLAVRRIAGRFGPGGPGLSPWHFTGVHVLSPALLDHVPADPFDADVNRHVYPALMDGRVRGVLGRGYWNDLGTPDRYLAANLDVLAGRVPLGRFGRADPFAGTREVAMDVRAAPSAHVDPAARLLGPALVLDGAVVAAGATVGPLAVIGPGAQVPSGAVVERAVVWGGTALGPGEVVREAIAAGADRVAAAGSPSAT